MFYVGQRVVCVDDQGHYGPWLPLDGTTLDGLAMGAVYTIRKVGRYRGTSSVWLNEIVRPISDEFGESGYDPRRFRPLVERKTDISIFKKMLTPNKRVKESVK